MRPTVCKCGNKDNIRYGEEVKYQSIDTESAEHIHLHSDGQYAMLDGKDEICLHLVGSGRRRIVRYISGSVGHDSDRHRLRIASEHHEGGGVIAE